MIIDIVNNIINNNKKEYYMAHYVKNLKLGDNLDQFFPTIEGIDQKVQESADKARREAISFSNNEFVKMGEFKADPLSCSYDEEAFANAGRGRTAAYGKLNGKGVYVIGLVSPSKYVTGKWCYLLSSENGTDFNPIELDNQIVGTVAQERFNVITFDTNTNTWYACRKGVYKSQDLVNWTETNFPSDGKTATLTIIDGIIYAGYETDRGMMISKDGGETVETLCNTYAIEFIAKHGNTLVGSQRMSTGTPLQKGVFVSHDNGETWSDITEKIPTFSANLCGGIKFFNGVFVFKCNEQYTNENAVLYWSEDGDTWNKCNIIDVNYIVNYTWDLFSDPDGQFLAVIPYTSIDNANTKAYITVDGKMWYPINGLENKYSYYFAWSRDGIVASGAYPGDPYFLKNISIDYKINNIQTAILNHREIADQPVDEIELSSIAGVIVDLVKSLG